MLVYVSNQDRRYFTRIIGFRKCWLADLISVYLLPGISSLLSYTFFFAVPLFCYTFALYCFFYFCLKIKRKKRGKRIQVIHNRWFAVFDYYIVEYLNTRLKDSNYFVNNMIYLLKTKYWNLLSLIFLFLLKGIYGVNICIILYFFFFNISLNKYFYVNGNGAHSIYNHINSLNLVCKWL